MSTLRTYHFRILALAMILLFIVPACTKDKTPCVTDCPESNCEDIQGVKDYFAFKVGSWWVYEEETSGERDSVYVTEYANDPTSYNFDMRVYSTYQDFYYHFYPTFSYGSSQCSESGITCSSCVQVKRSKYQIGNVIGNAHCFFFINKIGESMYTYSSAINNNKITIELKYDDFQLGQLTFNKTIKIGELNTHVEGQQPTNHFYSEGIGLIKKELLDSNQVWNLVDYHIEN
ncbi:MAG: hypothetical protein ACI8XB_002917 [Patiriisocius sp.]|jgi:hypothetical protein